MSNARENGVIGSLAEKNIIGPIIRQLREKCDLSQQALVERVNRLGLRLSTASLSKIETQKRGVSDIEILAFSSVFGVPVESLFNGGKLS